MKPSLSIRELEILHLLTQGHKYQEIADQLYISKTTLITHCCKMMKKLHAKNANHLISLAFRKKYIEYLNPKSS